MMDEIPGGGCDVRWKHERRREDMKTGEKASHTLQIRHLTYKKTLKHNAKLQHSFPEFFISFKTQTLNCKKKKKKIKKSFTSLTSSSNTCKPVSYTESYLKSFT